MAFTTSRLDIDVFSGRRNRRPLQNVDNEKCIYESNRNSPPYRGMCYNRTKVVEIRINTGLFVVFNCIQFAQNHCIFDLIHSNSGVKFHSAVVLCD